MRKLDKVFEKSTSNTHDNMLIASRINRFIFNKLNNVNSWRNRPGALLRGAWLALVFLFLLVSVDFCCRAEAAVENKFPPKHALFLVSYNMTQSWTRNVVDRIEQEMGDSSYQVYYNMVLLDSMRTRDEKSWQSLLDRELPLIQKGRYDFIVALDDEAVNLLAKNFSSIPQNVPIIIGGYEGDRGEVESLRQLHPNLSGVLQTFNAKATIDLGLKLWPDTREVVILSDSTPAGQRLEKNLQATLPNYPQVKVSYLDNKKLSTKELFGVLVSNPAETLLCLCPWRGLDQDDYQTLEAFCMDLGQHLPRPFMVFGDMAFGQGTVGGYVVDSKSHGTQIAEVIKETLDRGSAAQVPIGEGVPIPIFDYQVMKEHHLDFNVLPSDTVFVNNPPTLWGVWHREILAGLAIMVLIIIAAIVWVLQFRKIMLRNLAVYQAMPAHVGVTSSDERILFFSAPDLDKKELGQVKHLRDFKELDYGKVSAAFKEVFAKGEKAVINYRVGDVKRSMIISPINEKMYGQKAVVWISNDNKDLQNALERAENIAQEHKKTLSILQDTLTQFQAIMDNMPAFVLFKDIEDDFRILLCNKRCTQAMGMPAEKLVGHREAEYFTSAQEAGKLHQVDEIASRQSTPHECLMSFGDANGSEHICKYFRKVLTNERGKRVLFVMATDVTELENARKQSEKWAKENENNLFKLQDTLDQLQAIMDNIPAFILFKDIENEFRVMLCNKACCQAVGLSNEQIIGRREIDIFHDPALANRVGLDDIAASQQSTPHERIAQFEDMKGNAHTNKYFRKVLINKGGKRILFQLSTDITDLEKARVRAEKWAKENENNLFKLQDTLDQLQAIMDNIPAFILFKDIENDFRILLCNRECCQTFGLSSEQIIGRREIDFFHGRAQAEELHRGDVEASRQSVPSECISRITNRNGSERINRFFRKVLTSKNGKRVLFVMATDVTELEEAKCEQQETNNLLQAVIDSTPIYFAVKDVKDDFRYIMVNDEVKHLTKQMGIQKDFIGKTDFEIFSKEAATKSRSEDEKAIRSEQVERNQETYNGLNGNVLYTEIFRKSYQGLNGRRLLLIAGVNVTEMEKSRLELQNANKLWNEVINTSPIYFFAKDADDDFRYVLLNDSFARFCHLKPEEVLGKRDPDLFADDEQRHYNKMDFEIMQIPEGRDFIEHVYGGGKRQMVMHTTKRPFTTVEGKRLLIGTALNVTNEYNLIESEQIMNECLANVATESDFNKNLDMMAKTLIEQVNADRIGVWRAGKDGKVTLYHECASEGMLPTSSIGPEKMCEFTKLLNIEVSGNEVITHSDEEGTDIGHTLKVVGTKSLSQTNIFVEGKRWGKLHVGFVRQHRSFSDVDLGIVRSYANLISLAWIRESQLERIFSSDYEKQLILNNIKIPVALLDASGKLLRLNSESYKLFKMDEKDFVSEDFELFKKRHSIFVNGSPIKQVLQTGKPLVSNIHFSDRDFTVHVEPIRNRNGNLINVLVSGIDMTELNRFTRNEKMINSCMERMLHEEDVSNALSGVLKEICHHLGADRTALLTYDSKDGELMGHLPYVYSAQGKNDVSAMFENRKVELSDAWYQRLLSRREIFLPDIQNAQNSKEIEEMAGSWTEGIKKCFCSLYATPIYARGRLWGSFALGYIKQAHVLNETETKFLEGFTRLMEVIIERKEAHDLLVAALGRAEESARQAQAADKAKSFFLASVSHELRTPLNAVLGFSELLLDGDVDKETEQEYLRNISFSGNSLLAFINDVLDLSKLEAGQMPIIPQEIDFTEFCGMLMKVFSPKAEEKNISLKLELEPMPMIYLDQLRMRQILFNLMGNAVRFTQAGSVSLSGTFEPTDETKGILTFTVADTGIGISPEDQTKIFQPFVQLSKLRGTNAGSNGTGLGLSISLRLVNVMGGKITIDSKVGEGSKFTVRIPNVQYSNDSHVAGGLNSGNQKKARKKSGFKNILLVDDVYLNLKVLNSVVKKFGVQTVLAQSGSEALNLLRQEKFDLIMTDLWMKEMNGEELVKQIRKIHEWDEIPVVAVTADVESKDNFNMNLFDGVVTKPITSETIAEVLHVKQSD